tara:strand:- start:5230 stop:5439 length:210 start_codon:yes stop_codon:yes gene_type:complete
MNILELRDALSTMIDDGHDEAQVQVVNGTGKVSPVMGWELSVSGRYEAQRGTHQQPPKKGLRFFTTSRF